jgi:hypothetical protein
MDEREVDQPQGEGGAAPEQADSGGNGPVGRGRPRRIAVPRTSSGGDAPPPPGERPASSGAPAATAVPAGDGGARGPDPVPTFPMDRPVGRFPSVVRVTRRVDVDLEKHTLAHQRQSRSRITGWLYQREEVAHDQAKPWYQVLCLTGVDYFSTLGYQPGIAFLAAGLLSPIATLILVAFTLIGALPTYRRVAQESPHGQGSIAMLERLLPRWRGKLFVLCLLGFAATSWIITITLSTADATAHIVENPFFPAGLRHNVGVDIAITLVLIGILGGVFLKGFKEAIGIAVLLVIIFLGLNAIVLARTLGEVGANPDLVRDWLGALRDERGNPLAWFAASLLVFPKLALGLSGFETGVAVMPVVQGDPGETDRNPAGRIRNAKKLLAAAALIMSVYLICSSLATTLLIPPQAFEEGGEANGRALAYLAHKDLGDLFGTAYDISTIAILWFAGASAMAGLLNLVPRYLPNYGMAPQWAAAQRPLVLVFTAISFLVTIIFQASVEAQGSAYATGVLSLMASASVAVTISLWRSRSRLFWMFLPITLIFFYITIQNIRVQPSGLVIAVCFIVAIVVVSIVSRVLRSTELRINRVVIDRVADSMLRAAIRNGRLRLVTHDPMRGTAPDDYEKEVREARLRHGIAPEDPVLLVEVRNDDPSVFANELLITGHRVGDYGLLRCDGPAIANAIAGMAIAIHGQYSTLVDLHMRWTPIAGVLDAVGEGIEFLLWGGGDMARIVELEVRREAIDDQIIVHAA